MCEYAKRVLAGPPLPETVAYLWKWMLELRRRVAPVPMVGSAPFTWTDLAAWSAFSGNVPTGDELEMLGEIEAIMLDPPKDLPEWDEISEGES